MIGHTVVPFHVATGVPFSVAIFHRGQGFPWFPAAADRGYGCGTGRYRCPRRRPRPTPPLPRHAATSTGGRLPGSGRAASRWRSPTGPGARESTACGGGRPGRTPHHRRRMLRVGRTEAERTASRRREAPAGTPPSSREAATGARSSRPSHRGAVRAEMRARGGATGARSSRPPQAACAAGTPERSTERRSAVMECSRRRRPASRRAPPARTSAGSSGSRRRWPECRRRSAGSTAPRRAVRRAPRATGSAPRRR